VAAGTSKLGKIATIVGGLARHPGEARNELLRVYNKLMLDKSPIKSVAAADFLGEKTSVTLERFHSLDGNVSIEELVFICALAQKMQPRTVVELGTFDGNTTLQMALNTPHDTRIYTLDLPAGAEAGDENARGDIRYLTSSRRLNPRFVGSAVAHKIVQCHGNSLTYDFANFTADGKPALIFIDAGHSYDCVRNDTEKALPILDREGAIVWHDYTMVWPGVFRYLVELSRELAMVHILGTSLVVYRRSS
jgi:hypothetical protein